MTTKKFTPWYDKMYLTPLKQSGQRPPHLVHATDLTKFGERNMEAKTSIRRGKREKVLARMRAKKNVIMPDGKLLFPDKAEGTYYV